MVDFEKNIPSKKLSDLKSEKIQYILQRFLGIHTIWYLHSQTVYDNIFYFSAPLSVFRTILIALLYANRSLASQDYKLVENQL